MRRDLDEGTIIGDHYRLQKRIAGGGMSIVWEAWDSDREHTVALKILLPTLADKTEFRRQFEREPLKGATPHANILPVYDHGVDDGIYYIVMKRMRGDLSDLIGREGRLDVRRALTIAEQVASALDAAHSSGVVHRDVKPANVLVDPRRSRDEADQAYLADFGIARLRDVTETRTSATSGWIGTPDYIAPEQAAGDDEIDGRADQYSLACVVYVMLTARPPFSDRSGKALEEAHRSAPRPAVRAERYDVPDDFDLLLARGMAIDRDDRFETCKELVGALRQSIRMPPPPRPARSLERDDRPGPARAEFLPADGGGTRRARGARPPDPPAPPDPPVPPDPPAPADPPPVAVAPPPPPPPDPRRRRRALLALLAAVSLAAVAVVLVVSGPDEPPTVKIGALYSTSHADMELGQDVLAGAQLAVDYINGKDGLKSGIPLLGGAGLPGLHGAQLRLVSEDIAGRRCNVGPLFNRLVDGEHVAAVIGSGQSTFTLQALNADYQRTRRVPLVNDISTAQSLTDRISESPDKNCPITGVHQPFPWFFRVAASDQLAAEDFFKLIHAARSRDATLGTRIAILHESGDIFGNNGESVTHDQARLEGLPKENIKNIPYGTVVGSASAGDQLSCDNPREHEIVKRLTQGVLAARSFHPNVLFLVSYGPDAIAIMQLMHHYGLHTPVLAFGSAFATTTFADDVARGNPSCGLGGTRSLPRMLIRTGGEPDPGNPKTTSPAAVAIAKMYRKRTGKTMDSRAAGGFVAALVLARAIDQAGTIDPERIQAALNGIDIPSAETIMPWNDVKFDDHGQNTGALVTLQQKPKVGGLRTVDPNDVGAAVKFLRGP